VQTTTNDSIAVVASTVKVRFSPSRDECTLLPADHELFPTAFKKKAVELENLQMADHQSRDFVDKNDCMRSEIPFRKSGA